MDFDEVLGFWNTVFDEEENALNFERQELAFYEFFRAYFNKMAKSTKIQIKWNGLSWGYIDAMALRTQSFVGKPPYFQ